MKRRSLGALAVAALVASAACSGSSKETMKDGEYAEAMATEHAADDPIANDASKGVAQAPKSTTVEYGNVEGKALVGYLAEPATEGPHPAVIVIHEWWGLNDNIRAMADKLAGEGYVALAVDMYGGTSGTTPEEAKALMMAAMEKPELGVANLRAARDFLDSKNAPKVGVIGWCFGGGWSLESGVVLGDRLQAVVMYYGRPKATAEEVEGLTAPLLGIFAEQDQGIPVEGVKTMEAALKAAGKDHTIVIYPDVGHAFANPSGKNYQAEAADKAWAQTSEFFAKHLR